MVDRNEKPKKVVVTAVFDAVPETMVWTLYHRASEARRPDRVLSDETAVELVDRIGFPFAERFGPAHPLHSQAQALRARRFDVEVERFLASHPDGTVVALGEGLETQFWRVDNRLVQWLSVDLDEPIAARRRLLPSCARQRTVVGSALDQRWMDEVDPGQGVLITAQGLLMYLQPPEAHQLISRCARRFPASSLVFDAVPLWLSARTMSGMSNAAGYQPPRCHGALTALSARGWRSSPAWPGCTSSHFRADADHCSARSYRCSAATSRVRCGTSHPGRYSASSS